MSENIILVLMYHRHKLLDLICIQVSTTPPTDISVQNPGIAAHAFNAQSEIRDPI
jgi:hypothetical protein